MVDGATVDGVFSANSGTFREDSCPVQCRIPHAKDADGGRPERRDGGHDEHR